VITLTDLKSAESSTFYNTNLFFQEYFWGILVLLFENCGAKLASYGDKH